MAKWGYAKRDKYYITEPRFFIITLQSHFQFHPDWYKRNETEEIVRHYYYILDSIIHNRPYTKKCLAKCKHCGIIFLADPRNAGRRDLGCPFGCSTAHRRESAKRRSIEYYQTPNGKYKKKLLNARRSKNKQSNESSKDQPGKGEECYKIGEMAVDSETVNYLQGVVSLIEGFRVTEEEILSMLRAKMRQHSMDMRKRIDYIFTYHLGMPP